MPEVDVCQVYWPSSGFPNIEGICQYLITGVAVRFGCRAFTFWVTGNAVCGREMLSSVMHQSYEAKLMSTPYYTDFVAWAEETAKLLRQRRFDEVDLDALVEEVEGWAKRDRKAMRSQFNALPVWTDQHSMTSRPRVPPASSRRCASPARSGG